MIDITACEFEFHGKSRLVIYIILSYSIVFAANISVYWLIIFQGFIFKI